MRESHGLWSLVALYEEKGGGEPPDRARLNRSLREVFRRIEVDPETGIFEFHWARGGESVMALFWRKDRRPTGGEPE